MIAAGDHDEQETNVRIGIIGAGHIGGTLTRRLTALGHDVRVANSRAPETLAGLTAETGATPVWAKDAAADAELVILSIPERAVPDLAPGIVDARAAGAPVIETNNYYWQRDGRIDGIEDPDVPESVWVSSVLGVPVFKVFNGINWTHLRDRGAEPGAEGRIALPIAGDDDAGRPIVSGIVDALGFDPVDAGPLAESWRQQPGTPVYGADLDAAGVVRALAETPRERPEQFRAPR
ncbi:NADPH-dependent F420 reductase [Luteimicrobium sp. DT211]|uniref:NADPH-dependent F420 reductase n=1 Tax=Luteimicrobium sp. DT211 TaxID=3393412 RepID=UPI003CEF52B4